MIQPSLRDSPPYNLKFPSTGRGVNPYRETRAKVPGYRSLSFSQRTKVVGCSMRASEEAEASSAGEQLAKEYSVETHRDDETPGGQAVLLLPGFLQPTSERKISSCLKKLTCAAGNCGGFRRFSNVSGER